MARSIATIQATIVAAKNADANLSGLTSASNVAQWNLWTWLIATVMNLLEQLWDVEATNLTAIAASGLYGTLAWWKEQALLWQQGDALTFNPAGANPNQPVYMPVDPTACIITQAAAIEVVSSGIIIVLVKVAQTVGGILQAIPAPQLVEFNSYLQQIDPAGVKVQGQSLNADNLRITANIYYNGQLDGPTVQAAIIAAINAYLASLPFNGTVITSAIEAIILGVPGVEDVEITDISARNGINAYISFTRVYPTESGYIIFDPVAPNDPATTLTMIAQ